MIQIMELVEKKNWITMINVILYLKKIEEMMDKISFKVKNSNRELKL